MLVKQFKPPNFKHEWAYWRDYEKSGHVIGIPYAESRVEPDNAQEIRELFKDCDLMAREYDEIDSVVSYLNHEVTDRRLDFQTPMSNSVEYLLLFNDHILVYLSGADEYLGLGDSETYFQLKGLVLLDENMQESEIVEIVNWFKEAFTF